MEKEELEEKAVQAALENNWQKAVKLNKQILALSADDIDTLNRLGYAFFKMGKIESARQEFQKVLKKDRYNPVALKNLKRLKALKTIEPQKKTPLLSPSLFLEEPGKTKTVVLVKIAPQKTLSSLSIGQPVRLLTGRYSIDVRAQDNTYLGVIPDDLSFRLIRLMKAGYKYNALIKNIKENFLSIFLKEIKRGSKLKGQPSFTIR